MSELKLDLAASHDWIISELAESRGVGDTMQRLIGRCRDARPHPDWDELAGLPYEDVADLQDWLYKQFQLYPPKKNLAGLWFGLFNPIYNQVPVADIYVCGTNQFTSDSSDGQWAVNADWRPKGRYAHSKILASIYKIAYRENGLENDAEYPLCLMYGAAVVRELLNSPNVSAITEKCGTPGIAVGFDSGDFVLLGRLTSGGIVSLNNADS
jgi:hypothetical protein